MNNLNIAYAALLHDIGKFYQRTTKISLLNSQEIASTPIHANGYHTHIHSGYTAKFFHNYLHLNDQLEKASSGHHINEVDEFDSISRDADRIEFVVEMIQREADLIVFVDVVGEEKIRGLGLEISPLHFAGGRVKIVALFIGRA